jgi:nucleoside-diphosphate-sugar epimerase
MENLQFVIQQLVDRDIEPGTYQMSDDEPISTNQLIELIAASKGKKAIIWKMNRNRVSALARFGDLLHLPINSERLKKLIESYMVSNNKLKKVLGIEKMPVSAEAGMKKTLMSFNQLK